jgi:hypothetical protein
MLRWRSWEIPPCFTLASFTSYELDYMRTSSGSYNKSRIRVFALVYASITHLHPVHKHIIWSSQLSSIFRGHGLIGRNQVTGPNQQAWPDEPWVRVCTVCRIFCATRVLEVWSPSCTRYTSSWYWLGIWRKRKLLALITYLFAPPSTNCYYLNLFNAQARLLSVEF